MPGEAKESREHSAPEVEIRNRHLPNAFQKRYDINDLLGKVKSQELKPSEKINARCVCMYVCTCVYVCERAYVCVSFYNTTSLHITITKKYTLRVSTQSRLFQARKQNYLLEYI